MICLSNVTLLGTILYNYVTFSATLLYPRVSSVVNVNVWAKFIYVAQSSKNNGSVQQVKPKGNLRRFAYCMFVFKTMN